MSRENSELIHTKYLAASLVCTLCLLVGHWTPSLAEVTGKDVSREAKETIEATKEYTYQQKEAFVKVIQRQLRDMDARIEALKATSSQASGETRAQLNRSIQVLEQKKLAAKQQLTQLKDSSASAWANLKATMHRNLDDWHASYQRAVVDLKE